MEAAEEDAAASAGNIHQFSGANSPHIPTEILQRFWENTQKISVQAITKNPPEFPEISSERFCSKYF
jgi:hypothetical protein